MATLGTDIYEVHDFINNLKKQNMDASENTLAMGIFGYLTDSFSHLMQNNIIVASEYINEMFPTRVKYEKNIIDHALFYNITDINATPATMQVTLCLLEEEVIKNLKDNKLYIDRKSPIYIGEFEFHLEYDIILTYSVLNNSKMYTARYDIQRQNPISNITNPYLTTPIRQVIGNDQYIFITCQIRQITYLETFKKVITDNYIENKTFEFEFENQLAAFDMHIKDGDKSFYITPVLQGSSTANIRDKYCYYKFIDSSNIRITFDIDSYVPTINTDITISVLTTQGAKGNFEYVEDIITSISSETYGYTDLNLLVKPLSESQYGDDKASIDEIKEMVPREAVSRGSITTDVDLNNYFNAISSNTNKLTFIKKADNQFERMFYAYLLLKDENNVIVPSNTVTIQLQYREIQNLSDNGENDFDSITNNRCIIKPGTKFKLDKVDGARWIAKRLYEDDYDDDTEFIYSLPFLMIVNTNPLLYTSYYLNIINKRYQLLINSDNINSRSELQFIALNCSWVRQYNYNRDTYTLKYQCAQNINIDRGMVELDDQGNIVDTNIRSIIVMKGIYGNSFLEGKLTAYDPSTFIYEFEFKFKTDDLIDENDYIQITNVYKAEKNGDARIESNFFNRVTDIDIYILYDDKSGTNAGKMGLDSYIPSTYENPIDDYTVSNIYSVSGGVDFFFNYTDIISSKTSITQEVLDYETDHFIQYFTLKSVPMIRASYIEDEMKVNTLIDIIETKRGYLENAITVLKDQFGIDFKFYNTYGPSNTFYIDNANTLLNRVNINLKFEVGLKLNADKSNINLIKNDIKEYIENLNNTESNLHMSNVITPITNKYLTDTLNYIEFVSINSYPTNHQFLERIPSEQLDVDIPPEFINIHYIDNEEMGITIDIIG